MARLDNWLDLCPIAQGENLHRSAWLEWMRLGWIMGAKDFSLQGIGSRLGAWWPTIGLAIRIAFVGSLFGLVLGSRPFDYVPWLATGWAVWGMISSAITGSAGAMNGNKGLMLAIPIPKEAFVVKVIVKEFWLLVQNSLLIFLVLLVFQVPLTPALLLLVPGLIITAVFLFGLGLILGPLVAKYKDFGPFISSVVGVMFFVLPIMWKPESIESELAHLILGLNPLYHYLQIVRLPLLSEVPTDINYLLATAGAVVFLVTGILVMKRSRSKIVYWA
jgi:ABC-type polysaccharide/polyol phosphate export permease